MVFDYIVIGAGASGVACSISAARNNKSVLLLEHKDRILKKVLVTGNGSCNFTNLTASINNYTGNNKELLENIFSRYKAEDIISFFNSLGIMEKVKSDSKVYPRSYQAASIVDALRNELERLKVLVKLEAKIDKIYKKDDIFYVDDYKAKKLVIATGGYSYKELGSDGSGYEILKKFGHTLTKMSPILVQLKVDKEYVKGLEGIRQDVLLTAKYKGEFIRSYFGELLFTPYGISGPTVFNLSYLTHTYGFDVDFYVDFMPDVEYDVLKDMLYERRDKLSHLEALDFLNGAIHKKLGMFLLKKAGIEKLNIKVSDITDENIQKLLSYLKGYRIRSFDTMGYKQAQVTAGGIDSLEVTKDFMSKKKQNLYIIGEALDIFGDCGGFNLHYAFSSGLYVGGLK